MPCSQLSCKHATDCQEADGKARASETHALIAEKTPRERKRYDHVISKTVGQHRPKADGGAKLSVLVGDCLKKHRFGRVAVDAPE